MVEHALRTGADTDVLLALRASEPETCVAYRALGRLVSRGNMSPRLGTPLHVWCSGGELDPGWRSRCDVSAESLWAELQLLRSLQPGGDASTWVDAFDELVGRRQSGSQPGA